MSYADQLDEYIEYSLIEGENPDVDAILEDVPVPASAGPSWTPSVGPVSAPTPSATFQDNDAPPRFAGASGTNLPPAMFRTQQVAAPPAMFGGAARMRNPTHEEEALAAVLMDLEEFADTRSPSEKRRDNRKMGALGRIKNSTDDFLRRSTMS